MMHVKTSIPTSSPIPGGVLMDALDILIGRYVSVQTYMEDPSILQPQISMLQKALRECRKEAKADPARLFEWKDCLRSSEDFFLENSYKVVSADEEDLETNSRALRRDLMHAHSACVQPIVVYHISKMVDEGIEPEEESEEEEQEKELPKAHPRTRMH